HEIERKEVRGGLVEPPIRQCDARVDRLELALKIEQIGAMPGKKTRPRMSFKIASGSMHVAEVGKSPKPLIVEFAERRHETIALARREVVGVLSDTHHHRGRADQRV